MAAGVGRATENRYCRNGCIRSLPEHETRQGNMKHEETKIKAMAQGVTLPKVDRLLCSADRSMKNRFLGSPQAGHLRLEGVPLSNRLAESLGLARPLLLRGRLERPESPLQLLPPEPNERPVALHVDLSGSAASRRDGTSGGGGEVGRGGRRSVLLCCLLVSFFRFVFITGRVHRVNHDHAPKPPARLEKRQGDKGGRHAVLPRSEQR